MKTFKAIPEVAAKLKELTSQIHEICVANGLPFVAGVILADDDEQITKAISGYAHADNAPAPNELIAAIEILKMDDVPAEVVNAIIARNKASERLKAAAH